MDDLSKLSGISKNTIYTIENERGKDVGVETIRMLSKALGVKPFELIGDGPDPISVDDVTAFINRIADSAFVNPDEASLIEAFRNNVGPLMKAYILYLLTGEDSYKERFRSRLKNPSPADKAELEKIQTFFHQWK